MPDAGLAIANSPARVIHGREIEGLSPRLGSGNFPKGMR
jgi:hypothetical protein